MRLDGLSAAPAATTAAACGVCGPGADVAQGFAVLFARRYLAWSGSSTGEASALAPYESSSTEPELGRSLPAGRGQAVEWAVVGGESTLPGGTRLVTVLAQTTADGLVYLDVPVRESRAGVSLGGYPSIVGPPPASETEAASTGDEVEAGELRAMIARALGNYLHASSDELDADLAPGLSVATPARPMQLLALDRLTWVTPDRVVAAQITARDAAGAQYVLAYTIGVRMSGARWEISELPSDR